MANDQTTNDRAATTSLMRIAYLDCFSGMSGDMFLGALVDAGVPPQLLEETVAALNIGARLEISRVQRNSITAIKVDVYSNGEKDLPREIWEQQREQSGHAHPGPDDSAHSHDTHFTITDTTSMGTPTLTSGNRLRCWNTITACKTPLSPSDVHAEHGHSHSHEHGRGLNEIRSIIGKAAIHEEAKKTAIAIFEALGSAEAKIHDTSIEKIHFHEVGAVDAMVDIVCAAVGAEALGVDEILCSPLNVGGGTVKCAHGTLPVPAPATLELLKDAPIYSSGIPHELVTPTGAAIVENAGKTVRAVSRR